MGSLATLFVYLALNPFTIVTVASGTFEKALGMSSLEICQNHTVLNDKWREIGSKSGDNCDSDLQEGWYRLMTTDGHSASLPTTCIKNHVCGLEVAMWLNLLGEDLPQPGQTVPGSVCGSYPVLGMWQCCVVKETAFVHNCGNYFVYWLRSTDRCSVGYCGEGPRSDISPHTVKTGEPVSEASERFRRRPRTYGKLASNRNLDIDDRAIRDVSTPDDTPCPDGQQRCSDGTCVASTHLCLQGDSSSVSPPSTTSVNRAPITLYFSVLRDRTRAPVSFTSGQLVSSAHTNEERNAMGRLDSASLSKEEETKRMHLDITPSTARQMLATTTNLSIGGNLSSDRDHSPAEYPNSVYSSTTTTTSYSGRQMSMVVSDLNVHQQSSQDSLASKPIGVFTTKTIGGASDLVTESGDVGSDTLIESPTKTEKVETWRHHASLHEESCSSCLLPSVASSQLMTKATITNTLSSITSFDLSTEKSILTRAVTKEHGSAIAPNISSSILNPHTVASSIVDHPISSTLSRRFSPSSIQASFSTYVHIHSVASKQVLSSIDLQNTPSPDTKSYHTSYSPASYHAPYSTASYNIISSKRLTISSVSSDRLNTSPSVTTIVIPSEKTTLTTSHSPDTTDVQCTKCIQVVFNIQVVINDKQAERDFKASVQTAFSKMLTKFYDRRLKRGINMTQHHRNNTHFQPTDIFLRNTTLHENNVVMLVEAKHPSGDYVPNQYLESLLQKSEVRQFLEQDLGVYGATLVEFSVPFSPTEIPHPSENGRTPSIFAQHFGIFLALIILSSFVAFAAVIAIVYLRNKARTGMWYCPSGTRYAKQLERTLLTKTTSWRIGQVTNPIPDVDILRGEGPMTETTVEEAGSRRTSCTGERTSIMDSSPEVDTWVIPLEEARDDGLVDAEYDTRL
ncbi:uncharacterized protein LOC132556056 [Ylistrum balloti]|uniref:uncharacterized protein LOC132556056 n=1 Tax=Ylistrum balloti TaxID=509963 RepID=UPI002905D420|nr:uncharacterized protein LOC132556056 [Ylistrum balloti]